MTNIENLISKNKHLDILKLAGEMGDSMNVSAYLVGGYVRDLLLGKELVDIDIMVDKEAFKFSKNLSKKLNVNKTIDFDKFLTSRIPYKECEIEISNARKEEYKEDSRKPINVRETTINEDLIRRDFTINTLAVSLNKKNFGKLIDPFNGIIDLNNGLIKTPADPTTTFIDDPLRMLRAIRFAAQLEFSINEDTKKSISENKDRLQYVTLKEKKQS